MDSVVLLWIAGTLGAATVGMRLVRSYGDEILDFVKWFVNSLDQIRKLRG